MSKNELELKRLEEEYALLLEKYKASNQERNNETDEARRVVLKRKLEVFESELDELDKRIAVLRRKVEKERQEREEEERRQREEEEQRRKKQEEEEKQKRPRVQHTFELTLIKNGTGCRIVVRDPQGQNIQVDIQLPQLPNGSQSADIKLSDAIGQGRLLYNTFFPHPISNHFIEALDTAKKQGDLLVLLIKTNSADGYIDLAWEWLNNGNGFFVLQYPLAILRLAIQPNKNIPVIAPKAPPCVLFTSATPQGYDDFALPEEAIFQSVGHQMVHEKRITARRFLHRIMNGSDTAQPFNIWHYHGYASPSGFFFCDVQRHSIQFPIEEIAKTLRLQKEYPIWMAVVVLETSQDTPLPSAFMALDVPLILVFPANMRPLVLQTFLDTFYQHLGSLPPENAMHKAQMRASQLCVDDIQWAMPILISHVPHTWGKYDR